MKTNFQMLRELLEKYHPEQRGVISWAEYKMIRDTLCIGRMNVLQLRKLRDFVVAHMGKSEDMEDWDRMSAIVTVIDDRINELGGEI